MSDENEELDYMDEYALAEHLGLTRSTLQRWRREGIGPPFAKLAEGTRSPVRYSKRQVREWLEARTVHATGQ